jgi:parallel beta-helix repeat protein
VNYDSDSNTITMERGDSTGLAGLRDALNQPDLLQELTPGEWRLAANLQINEGASLHLAAPEVRRLKLRSDEEAFVWIRAFGGELTFTGTEVSSWDSTRNGVDENYADGRSFVLARSGARMNITDSVFTHLGYAADESYGVAWRLEGTRGEAVNSRFGYNYYGLYSYEVPGLVIRGNEVHHSVQYGIDPHTKSNHLLIEGNRAHNNGKHGIILAEGCSDSIIRNNEVFNNQLHGIVLYQRSNNNLVEGNTVYGNALEGININNANGNTVRNNTVYENGEAGIGVGQGARNNQIIGNTARNNGQDGIYFYSNARENSVLENLVADNQRYGIYIKSERNREIEGNQVSGNTIGIFHPGEHTDQQIQDANRVANNRTTDIASEQ